MTVKFCFGNLRKDGTKNLKIRLKHRGRDQKIGLPGVYIDPKYWDASNNRVKSTYVNAAAYNEIVAEYQEKINVVKGKLELGQINYLTAYQMLSNSSAVNSIFEFVKIHCKDKSVQWHRNTLGVLNSIKVDLGLTDVTFEDITLENLKKLKAIHKAKNNQPETFNTYLRHLKAVYRHAYDMKMTYRHFDFPKGLFYKVNKHNKKLLTHTPEDIAQAIDKIQIKSKHRSARKTAIRDIEAIGFWMLQFCLRGLYGKDLTSLSAFDSDFNYKYYLQYTQANAKQEPQIVPGNSNFINHKRHKTKNIMQFWITLPPILDLIFILKILVAQTHPKRAYLNADDLKLGLNELHKKEGYDILKIFNHSPEEYKLDDAIWNNFNEHLNKLGLHSFMSARKSFNTMATHLRIHPSITRTLVGHTDKTIQSSYNNFNDVRLVRDVHESHLQILNEFKMIELFDKWVFKINELFDAFHDMHIGGGSRKIYSYHIALLKESLKKNKTTIDDLMARAVYVGGKGK